MINRVKQYEGYMYDGDSKFFYIPVKGGVQIVSRDNAPVTLDLELITAENGRTHFWWGPKEMLWQQLKKLDLKDAVIIAKIRKACSSNPEGPD